MKYLCEACHYNSANNHFEPTIEIRNGRLFRQDECAMQKPNYPRAKFCEACDSEYHDPEAA